MRACRVLADKERDKDMMQSLNRHDDSDEPPHSSDDDNEMKAYTLAIISKMNENEQHFKAWQTTAANLSRDKTVLIENVTEKLNEDGSESYVVAKSKEKATKRDITSFGNLHDLSDDEVQPQIRATFAYENRDKGTNNLVGKIVFFKDIDVELHPFE